MFIFTIEEFNERITAFDFLGTKPTDIDLGLCKRDDSKIKQSASQMMALCHEFALIIDDKIPESEPHWHIFLVLLRICSCAVAPLCTHDLIAYLRICVEEYLRTFRELYPRKTLIPKQHYMLHYASQMDRFGPLIHSWTMRQESKLSFVKRVSRSSNYKNVAKTVAQRHQFWFCYQIQSNSHMLTPQLEVSPKQLTNTLACEDDYVQSVLKHVFPSLCADAIICHPNWVNLQSSHFYKGLYVLVKYDDMNPTFGKIIDLITIEGVLIICVIEYCGDVFISHYNAFRIKSRGIVSAINVYSLSDHRPFYARSSFSSSDNNLYITLPYYF